MGSIVAFEGTPDVVLTQLRLLPPSPYTLILPSIMPYIKPRDGARCFDARDFIRQVHLAFQARNQAARDFLDGSTADRKRLVFLNGGTLGAQALCVKKIMEYETQGDQAQAEYIFQQIAKDGLAGPDENDTPFPGMLNRSASDDSDYPSYGHVLEEDPITKAMRAADALDRQTANLQPSGDLNFTMPSRKRSSSLPVYGYCDDFDDSSTPYYVFGAPPNQEDGTAEVFPDSLRATPNQRLSVMQPTPESPDTTQPRSDLPSPSIYSTSGVGESHDPNAHGRQLTTSVAPSPASETSSMSFSEHVVFGEASVLDMRRMSKRNSLFRAKSLDRKYSADPRVRHFGMPTESWLDESDTPRISQHTLPTTLPSQMQNAQWLQTVVDKPRTVVVKAQKRPDEMEPVLGWEEWRASNSVGKVESRYVDRCTNTRYSFATTPVFEPILSPVEDLIVFFKDDAQDFPLESAISTFRNRRYPVLSYSPAPSDVENMAESLPGTPTPLSPTAADPLSINIKSPDAALPSLDDCDPFAYAPSKCQGPKVAELAAAVALARRPTPSQASVPTMSTFHEQRVHEFSISCSQTAVSIQNSLRAVLGEHFPPDTAGYGPLQFSPLPEFDGLWKPILRDKEPNRWQKDDGSRTQILAIGPQRGVEKKYSLAMIGRLEEVGRKSCEVSKTDRVDFRYLLAKAMQEFTARRLADQTDNPFTNSNLLATLLIPPLETYLDLHSEVQYLLLTYPPEHLSTVLALQNLVGVDVLKVAQIVESIREDDLTLTHTRRRGSIDKKSDSKPAQPLLLSRSSSTYISPSQENYWLTCSASEEDIATFVSRVWNIDTEQDESSLPSEQAAEKPRKKRPPPLSLEKEDVKETSVLVLQSPLSSTRMLVPPPEPESSALPVRALSIADSIETSKMLKSKSSRSNTRATNGPRGGPESSKGFYMNDDSDDDMDERRLMPVCLQKKVAPKPSSRKALKFLGLA